LKEKLAKNTGQKSEEKLAKIQGKRAWIIKMVLMNLIGGKVLWRYRVVIARTSRAFLLEAVTVQL